MPKSPKQHHHQARHAIHHRRSERRTDENASREPSPLHVDCLSIADTHTLSHVGSRKGQEDVERSLNSNLDDTRATIEIDGAPQAVDQARSDIQDCRSLCSSEASTILTKPDDDILAGITPDTCLEEVEFEFDSVIHIDGDQCQVRWADSTIREVDLCGRFLHGIPLLEYVSHLQTLGDGLYKVSWNLTWEPVNILQGYEDVVQRDLQFVYGDVIRQEAGYSLVQWEDSVIHKSTLQSLRGHPLCQQVRSVSYPLAHGYVEVGWQPMWVPANIMEDYGIHG
ncbi:hypothetical protein Q7P37_008920 [Cladosporium fusiforme]